MKYFHRFHGWLLILLAWKSTLFMIDGKQRSTAISDKIVGASGKESTKISSATNSFTTDPTYPPSYNPTSAINDIAFTAFQMYNGLSCDTYQAHESTYQQIIASTVVSVLNNDVATSDLTFISYSSVLDARDRRLKGSRDSSEEEVASDGGGGKAKDQHEEREKLTETDSSSDWCTITYTVAYSGQNTYDALSGELITAVDDGRFNTILHDVAPEFDIDADNVTSAWVSTDDFALTPVPTIAPTTVSPVLSDQTSYEPTSIPTVPTLQPTSAAPIAFTVFQLYNGLSCDTYQTLQTTYQQIIASTAVSVMNNDVATSDLTFISYSSVVLRARKLNGPRDSSEEDFASDGGGGKAKDMYEEREKLTETDSSSDWCTITYTVAYSGQNTYDALSGELITAVDDGRFNTILHDVASEFDIDADNVTSAWVSTDDFALTPVPTISATNQPLLQPTTESPTQNPTTSPTLYSTDSTLQPTSTSSTTTFTAFQMYEGFSCDTYQAIESTVQQIIAATVVSAMDNAVTTADVSFISYSSVKRARSRALKGPNESDSSDLSSHQIDSTDISKFLDLFSSSTDDTLVGDDADSASDWCTITYTVTYSADYTYALLSGELIDSVDDGLFDTIFHYLASDMNNVTSPWVSTYDYAATSSPTFTAPSTIPTASPLFTPPEPTPTSYTPIPTSKPSTSVLTPSPTPLYSLRNFTAFQTYDGLSCDTYNATAAAIQPVIADTLVSVLDSAITASGVEFVTYSSYQRLRSRKLKGNHKDSDSETSDAFEALTVSEDDGGDNDVCTVIYTVSYTADFTYDYLSSKLIDSVDNGLFDTVFQYVALTHDIDMDDVTSPYVSTFDGTAPTNHPTEQPTTSLPTQDPTQGPTEYPSLYPTSSSPSDEPTYEPTVIPTAPTNYPTEPTYDPTEEPTTALPSQDPTEDPTEYPSLYPTSSSPSDEPTYEPTVVPTAPTNYPTEPTYDPTEQPTTALPTQDPTEDPTEYPSLYPTSAAPVDEPTYEPTYIPTAPTNLPTEPTYAPTEDPTMALPTTEPTECPSLYPTSAAPSNEPTYAVTGNPTYTQNIFFGDQVVYGITYSDYEANEESVENIMAQAIVAALNNQMPYYYVEYLSISNYVEASPGLVGIQVVYSVNYVDADDFDTLSAELTNAVQDGTFTTELQNLAEANNVSVLYNASSASVLVFQFTKNPTFEPSLSPTTVPTFPPTTIPSEFPTSTPTDSPTDFPTNEPTVQPTSAPTTAIPTQEPTGNPTAYPTSASPTLYPTSGVPSDEPTYHPTAIPTTPTTPPTTEPTYQPTHKPTLSPTPKPSHIPTVKPTHKPTNDPTELPTATPTDLPTLLPTDVPTFKPTDVPTLRPTDAPVFDLIANQVVNGLSDVDFDSAPNATFAFVESVYTVLNGQIPRDDINVAQVFPYTGRRRLQATRLDQYRTSQGQIALRELEDEKEDEKKEGEEIALTEDSSAINVIYWVTFYDSSIYATLYDQIKGSVLNGTFTTILQENAVKYAVPVLEGVTTSSVSMYEFTWAPTPGPTYENNPISPVTSVTSQPTHKPTHTPTLNPTPRPTDFVSFTILATQSLSGIDMDSYKGNESNVNNVFTDAVASTFGNGVEPEDVTITNVTEIFTLAKPFGADLSPTLHVDYNIFVDHLDGFQDDQAGFDAVAANYTEAVVDGTFTSNLQAIAAAEGVTSLANVNSQNATLKLLTATPTAAPTVASKAIEDTYLIIAAMVLTVAACFLIYVIGYYCHSSSSSRNAPAVVVAPAAAPAPAPDVAPAGRAQGYGATAPSQPFNHRQEFVGDEESNVAARRHER